MKILPVVIITLLLVPTSKLPKKHFWNHARYGCEYGTLGTMRFSPLALGPNAPIATPDNIMDLSEFAAAPYNKQTYHQKDKMPKLSFMRVCEILSDINKEDLKS